MANSPELQYPKTVLEQIRAHRKALGGVSLLLASTLFLGGCSTGPSARTKELEKPATNMPNEITQADINQVNSPAAKEVDKYDDAMEKYQDMDISTFEEQPRSPRLAFAQYRIDRTLTRGNYDGHLAPYSKGGMAEKYALHPGPASLKDDGQAILDHFLFATQVSYLQFQDGDQQPFDSVAAAKVLSASFYEVADSHSANSNYKGYKNAQQDQTDTHPMDVVYTAQDTSEVRKGLDNEDQPVEYKQVTFKDNLGKTWYARFIYTTFTNYDGKKKSTWLLDQQSTSLQDLNNNYSIHDR